MNAPCKLIDLPEARALDNVNTPEESREAARALQSHGEVSALAGRTSTPKTLRIEYFAVLREQAGRREEIIDSGAHDASDLYEHLRKRHGFALSAAQLKVAVNGEFSDWSAPLKHGDTVVFIPPVAGG